MDIKIKNYRGIESAEITLAPIALVAGPNGAGKTSITQAVAAALTSNAAIVDGVTKAGVGVLLRDGAKRGQCALRDLGGVIAANWPGGSISVEGDHAPHASAIACGLDSIATMKPKDAAAALQAALHADPTQEQLTTALHEAGARPEMAQAVAAKVQAEGYDAGWKRAQTRATELKGQWELITGERWGAAKAPEWQAAALPQDADLAALKAASAEADAALERAIANQAADAAHVAHLHEQVDAGEAAATTLDDLEAEQARAREAHEAARNTYSALPRPEHEEETVPCPKCGTHLVIRGRVLAETAPVNAKENAKRKVALDQHDAALREARSKEADAARAVAQATMARETGAHAMAELARLNTDGTSAEDVAHARQAAHEAHAAVRAIETTTAAREKHQAITEMLAVAEVLAPTGIRQQALDEAMAALHWQIHELALYAHWRDVTIGPDLAVTYGDRPYHLLSASEQFRARVLLQVAIAMHDGSSAVLIDAADILDRTGRNGLFQLLTSTPLRALVTMTLNRREDVPALGRIGRSYWISDASTEPLAANDNKAATAGGAAQG